MFCPGSSLLVQLLPPTQPASVQLQDERRLLPADQQRHHPILLKVPPPLPPRPPVMQLQDDRRGLVPASSLLLVDFELQEREEVS